MGDKVRVLVWDGNEFREEQIENEIHEFYRLIGCTTFDIVQFSGFDCYIDDEGKLKDNAIVTAVRENDYLVGTLVFAKHDEVGETLSLTDEDIEKIKSFQVKDLGENMKVLAEKGGKTRRKTCKFTVTFDFTTEDPAFDEIELETDIEDMLYRTAEFSNAICENVKVDITDLKVEEDVDPKIDRLAYLADNE